MGGVTQLLTDHLRVDTLGQENRRDRVPKVMQPDRRQPCVLGLANEQARKRLWVHRSAVLGRDDEARVGVVGPQDTARPPGGTVDTNRLQDLQRHREGTTSLGRLGLSHSGSASSRARNARPPTGCPPVPPSSSAGAPSTRALRRARNRPGGYWVAAADPQAASQAVTGSLPDRSLHRAVLLSDDATAVYLALDGAASL
jgi:hypothetical protein